MNVISQTVPVQFDTAVSPYAARDWKQAFADLRKKGFTGVEIAVAYPDEQDADEVLFEAEKNGLKITTISTGQVFGRDGLFLASEDADIRARAMEIVRGHIRLSQRLQTKPNVTIGLLRGKPDFPKETCEALLQKALLPLVTDAEKAGVILQIEPINHAETTFLNGTEDTLAFLHTLGDPENVGLLFDAYHANIEDGDLCAAARLAGKRITNVHIADSHRGLPGEGTIDFPAVIAAILKTGYTGAFALETLCVPSREHVLKSEGEALLAVMRAAETKI